MLKQAFGYYLNVYGYDYDVFIIFNEPNEKPSLEEIREIGNIVEQALDAQFAQDAPLYVFHENLKQQIEDTRLSCVHYGIQLIVRDL